VPLLKRRVIDVMCAVEDVDSRFEMRSDSIHLEINSNC